MAERDRPAAGGGAAPASTVRGGACGYYTDPSVFGRPVTVRGCGQTVPQGTKASATTATRTGATGSTTIVRGALATEADPDGNPTATAAVPTHPPVNHTVTGTTSSGDSYRAVFNEQTVDADGTITVVAVHIYLLGPTALGDIVVAESHAGA